MELRQNRELACETENKTRKKTVNVQLTGTKLPIESGNFIRSLTFSTKRQHYLCRIAQFWNGRQRGRGGVQKDMMFRKQKRFDLLSFRSCYYVDTFSVVLFLFSLHSISPPISVTKKKRHYNGAYHYQSDRFSTTFPLVFHDMCHICRCTHLVI